MYPVPSLAKQLELEWATELAARFGCTEAEFRENSTRFLQFSPQRLRVELMDGSFVEFRNAIALVSEPRKTIAVFTEHCGHHLYPYHEARVLVDKNLTYEQRAA
jgi:hypothetical protein